MCECAALGECICILRAAGRAEEAKGRGSLVFWSSSLLLRLLNSSWSLGCFLIYSWAAGLSSTHGYLPPCGEQGSAVPPCVLNSHHNGWLWSQNELKTHKETLKPAALGSSKWVCSQRLFQRLSNSSVKDTLHIFLQKSNFYANMEFKDSQCLTLPHKKQKKTDEEEYVTSFPSAKHMDLLSSFHNLATVTITFLSQGTFAK